MMNCVVVNLRSWLCLLCLFFAACGSSPEPLPDGGVTVDSGVNVCRCDVSRACEAGCACDRDCGGGCGCDVSRACDDGCACDADCRGGCACDVGPGCDCGCDPDCTMELCSDTCEYQGDGECDDGGPGSATDLCAFGTDCSDCGSRTPACEPDCSGRECGGDGCGGNCGVCAPADTCVDFRCVSCACDTSSACDAGCESCDPDCCVEPDRPSTVATAWVNASVVSEEPVDETLGSIREANYEVVVRQDAVAHDGQLVALEEPTNNCRVTFPRPPTSCMDVRVVLRDLVIVGTTGVEIAVQEERSRRDCVDWLRRVERESFDVECTEGALRWPGVCSPFGPRATIAEHWTLEVRR